MTEFLSGSVRILVHDKYKLSQKAWSTLSVQKIVITKNVFILKVYFLQYRLVYYNVKQTLTVRVSETGYSNS